MCFIIELASFMSQKFIDTNQSITDSGISTMLAIWKLQVAPFSSGFGRQNTNPALCQIGNDSSTAAKS
jgi:hypothetical protein